MSEPTSSINRTVLLRYVGRFLGVSRTAGDWTGTDIDDDVDDYIASGERGFYFHDMILPGEETVHRWSFLVEPFSMSVASGEWQHELPDNFGGFVGSELQFSQADNAWHSVQLTSVDEILRERAIDNVTGLAYPILAAVEPFPSGQTQGQRQKLMLWPTPTTNLTLTGQYTINPSLISSTTPYPFGGQQHSETLIESCLSAAELLNNDEEGPHTQKFRRLLAASILRDRQRTTPRFFGTMHDPSCPGWKRPPARYHRGEEVTIS